MPTSTKAKTKRNAVETSTNSLIRIPVENAQSVEMRYALLNARDRFDPLNWAAIPLQRSSSDSHFYELNLEQLKLTDGSYEYEFIVDGKAPLCTLFS